MFSVKTGRVRHMISIQVEFLSSLVNITKEKKILVDVQQGSTVKMVLEALVLRYGKDFNEKIYDSSKGLSVFIIILLNGQDIRSLKGINAEVREGDTLVMIPAIAGG